MALTPGYAARFSLDNAAGSPVDISSWLDNISGWDMNVDSLDATTFGTGSKSAMPGLKDGDQVTLSGPWDSTLYAQLVAMRAAQSATTMFTGKYSPAGTASGMPHQSAEFFVTKLAGSSAVAGRGEISFTLQMSGACTTGTY